MIPHKLTGARARIVGIDTPAPLADGSERPYINFDNAASTPVLREVLDALNDFMPWYSSVHRGAGFKSRIATRAYEDARDAVAAFVGADAGEHLVVFGKNTTEAINKLAHRIDFAPDDLVLVSTLDHHSNDLPWRGRARVLHIGADPQGRLDEAHFEQLIAAHAGRVRLVAVTGASNVTGHMPRIHHLAERAHAAGARILVDAAQLAPHRGIDMRPLADPAHIDYLALSAHKMYAPFGCGALIGRRDTFERGAPEYAGGGTVRYVGMDAVVWADSPDRDEAGSPNVVGAVALAAAMQALSEIGMEAIAAHEAELVAHALHGLAQIKDVRIYGDADPTQLARRTGVIPFTLGSMPHALVAAILSAEYGIGVRSGCFCAHPYLAHLLGLSAAETRAVQNRLLLDDRSGTPGLVRVSFGLYNTVEEIDQLLAALRAISRGAHRRDYLFDPAHGEYRLAHWLPDDPPELKALGTPALSTRSAYRSGPATHGGERRDQSSIRPIG